MQPVFFRREEADSKMQAGPAALTEAERAASNPRKVFLMRAYESVHRSPSPLQAAEDKENTAVVRIP